MSGCCPKAGKWGRLSTAVPTRRRTIDVRLPGRHEFRGPWSLFVGPRCDHHDYVGLSEARISKEATSGSVEAERPVRHHRVRTVLLVLLSFVALFVLVSVVLTVEGRARPVSISQAIGRYHSNSAADPGTHPRPGVYSYQGSGTDRLTLPPLSQSEGPTLPGTVEVQSNGCWSFRIDYSTNHWQTWTYCGHSTGLVETGGLVWQRWMVGPVAETNLSTLRCSPGLLSIPSSSRGGQILARPLHGHIDADTWHLGVGRHHPLRRPAKSHHRRAQCPCCPRRSAVEIEWATSRHRTRRSLVRRSDWAPTSESPEHSRPHTNAIRCFHLQRERGVRASEPETEDLTATYRPRPDDRCSTHRFVSCGA